MDDASIKTLLGSLRRIAVVGLSPKPERASHGVTRFLIDQGFEVVGVNPGHAEILGLRVYPSLSDVPGPVDLVDIFRRSDQVAPIVDEAIARGDAAIWMQEGVVDEESAARARTSGLPVVMDRCLYKEWLRLMNA